MANMQNGECGHQQRNESRRRSGQSVHDDLTHSKSVQRAIYSPIFFFLEYFLISILDAKRRRTVFGITATRSNWFLLVLALDDLLQGIAVFYSFAPFVSITSAVFAGLDSFNCIIKWWWFLTKAPSDGKSIRMHINDTFRVAGVGLPQIHLNT